jgi:hypothetical protein
MKTIILLAIIGVIGISIVTPIVVYQFVEQQQAKEKLRNILNIFEPEEKHQQEDP